MRFIPPWTRLNNLEAAFLVHEKTIKELEERIDELEVIKDGKSCIGFVEDNGWRKTEDGKWHRF